MDTPGTVVIVDTAPTDRVGFTCLSPGKQLEKESERGFFVVGGVPEWLKGTGCKPVGYAYPGSNPGAPTICSLHARGRYAHIAQSAEHFLGKEEVTGSSPVVGSIDFDAGPCGWLVAA